MTWHSSNPFTLVIGSYHTVRFVNIRTYIDRLQSFIRKQNKPSAIFDYADSTMFINKIPTTHVYNLYDGDGPRITITDLLCCSISKDNILLLVGTTSGLFVIKQSEQIPIQLAFPKSIWTVSEYVESLRLINNQSSRFIVMNILHLDQIYCFNLERSLHHQQLHIIFTIPNPSRQMPTKIGLFPINNHLNNSFECILGNNHGSFHYHQIQSSTKTQFVFSWPENELSNPPSILSASLNKQYLCLTTNNNLICIYKRT